MTKLLSAFTVAMGLAIAPTHATLLQGSQGKQLTPADSARRAARKAERKEERKEEKAEKNEQHPHIRAAIRELEASKKELQTAAHDFGGHRVDAIKAIDEALKQLRLAQQFDKK